MKSAANVTTKSFVKEVGNLGTSDAANGGVLRSRRRPTHTERIDRIQVPL